MIDSFQIVFIQISHCTQATIQPGLKDSPKISPSTDGVIDQPYNLTADTLQTVPVSFADTQVELLLNLSERIYTTAILREKTTHSLFLTMASEPLAPIDIVGFYDRLSAFSNLISRSRSASPLNSPVETTVIRI